MPKCLWKATNRSSATFKVLSTYIPENFIYHSKNWASKYLWLYTLNGIRFLVQVIIGRFFTNRISNRDILRFCRMHRIHFHLAGCSVHDRMLPPVVLHPPNTNGTLHSFGQPVSFSPISKTHHEEAIPLLLRPTE